MKAVLVRLAGPADELASARSSIDDLVQGVVLLD
jgi:hypothetical protein